MDLRGIVDLLSTAIYSSPHVYLRELVQNYGVLVYLSHANELSEGSAKMAMSVVPVGP